MGLRDGTDARSFEAESFARECEEGFVSERSERVKAVWVLMARQFVKHLEKRSFSDTMRNGKELRGISTWQSD